MRDAKRGSQEHGGPERWRPLLCETCVCPRGMTEPGDRRDLERPREGPGWRRVGCESPRVCGCRESPHPCPRPAGLSVGSRGGCGAQTRMGAGLGLPVTSVSNQCLHLNYVSLLLWVLGEIAGSACEAAFRVCVCGNLWFVPQNGSLSDAE